MISPPKPVFLSYASQDASAARRVGAALQAAGVEVWFDQSELRGGDAWDASIRRKIKDCALFVPILSATTNARSEGYFRLEWKLAVERSHFMADDQAFIVPVSIDGIAEPGARVPEAFRARQWTTLPGGEVPPAFVERIKGLLEGNVPVAAEPPALRGAATPQAFGGRPAIAVLPFENLSQDPDQEYFADGLSEDLINRLSLFRAFPVIARNSTFTWKGRATDVRAVAADLGVRYVVLGSIRKSGQRARIAAKLVDASTGQQAWAQTYDRDLTDVFAVQDEISESIAASLVLDLNRTEHEIAQRRDPDNLEAWGLYQRALPLIYRFRREDHEKARELLARAVALDPRFAPASARLGEIHIWDIILGYTTDFDVSIATALGHSRRAVESDPRDAEARGQLAWALMTAGQGFVAVEEVRRAFELNPGNPWVLLICAWLRAVTGPSPQEAIEYVERARRLSPRDPAEWLFYDVQAGAFMIADRHEEALASARRLIQLWPGYTFGHVWCAMALARLGRPDEARESVRRADEAMPGITIAGVLQMLGAIAPEVSRRFADALARAGMP